MGMRFAEFPAVLYLFHQGGGYPSTAYVWRVTEPLDFTRDGAAYAKAIAGAPVFSTRSMMSEFFNRFSVLGSSKAALRVVYRHIAPELVVLSNGKAEEERDFPF